MIEQGSGKPLNLKLIVVVVEKAEDKVAALVKWQRQWFDDF